MLVYGHKSKTEFIFGWIVTLLVEDTRACLSCTHTHTQCKCGYALQVRLTMRITTHKDRERERELLLNIGVFIYNVECRNICLKVLRKG